MLDKLFIRECLVYSSSVQQVLFDLVYKMIDSMSTGKGSVKSL